MQSKLGEYTASVDPSASGPPATMDIWQKVGSALGGALADRDNLLDKIRDLIPPDHEFWDPCGPEAETISRIYALLWDEPHPERGVEEEGPC